MKTTTVQIPVVANTDPISSDPDQRGQDNIGARASRLGLEIANVRGVVEDLGVLNSELIDTVKLVTASASEAADATSRWPT